VRLEPYGAQLAGRGFHVLLIDLRGFGLSHRGPYGGERGAIADVRGATDELKRLGAKRVALVGASYGGVTALVSAPALGAQIAGVASLSGELDLGSGGMSALAAAPRIRGPLLVMGSRKDRLLDETDARRLVRAAGSTQAQLVEFDGYDHGWNLLALSHKQRADRVLVGFLQRVTD
jgi:alpha-beta hydrolase superfamily lysophospholipase